MKDFLKNLGVQASAILLAALGAGFIAFVQTIGIEAGACDPQILAPEEVGALGGSLKLLHTIITRGKYINYS
jgi:hypothetical protein